MLRAYKFRLYPNKNQEELLLKHFGSCRKVYNMVLDLHKQNYEQTGQNWNRYFYLNLLPQFKKQMPFLKEVNAQSLQQQVIDLDDSFKRFFKKQTGYPKFKSRKRDKDSFRVPQQVKIDFDSKKVYIPKFKEGIKYKDDRTFNPEQIRNATVSKTKSGKFFISIVVDDGITITPTKEEQTIENSIGIDVGIKEFQVISNNLKISNPEIKKYDEKLKRLHRELSRKQKGSRNRNKARIKLSKLYEKVNNIKLDFLHKLSRNIINEKQVKYIFIEDLNIKGMVKNHNLAKSISSASWYTFFTFLKYKQEEVGKHLIKIGRFFPSSKMCNKCGYKKDDLTLKDREWTCPVCGEIHDRDVNAALNIRNFGVKCNSTVGTTGSKACGEDVIPYEPNEVIFNEAGNSNFNFASAK